MLDQLVESKDNAGANKKRGGLLFTVGLLAFALAGGGLLWSLFAQNIGVGGDGLELSTLVSPVALPEEAPPPPEKEPEPEKKQQKAVTDENVDVRREIISNINESPQVPKEISTSANNVKARREGVTTILGNKDSNAQGAPRMGPAPREGSGNSGGGLPAETKTVKPDPPKVDKPKPPPPPPPKPKPTPKPVPKRISGGVVNGKAVSLPKPAYPAAARAVRASGAVRVSVVIGKNGRVISASASGHPLLKAAALSAARRARFRPTMLSGQPVEVSGVIIYNFKP